MHCLRLMRTLARTASSKTASLKPGRHLPKRTFTTHPPTRPTPFSRLAIHQPQTSLSSPTSTTTTTLLTGPLDLLPKISSHPALAGLQVRNGPRDTYDPSHRVRKRRAGFLARNRTRTGRAILKRRRVKGRNTLSH